MNSQTKIKMLENTIKMLEEKETGLTNELKGLITAWRNNANGHYCQTYNKGMADGLLGAADDLQTLIIDLEA
jgi:hypothetical protein